MRSTTYELKYCERCGTLKLRPVASGTTYCPVCERLLARYAFPRGAGIAFSSQPPSPPELKNLAGIPLTVYGDGASGRVQ